MRGTGDWGADERPKSYREMILYLYPNGDAPLTALLSKMSMEKVDDPEFNWWTKSLPQQGGAITGVFTDDALTTGYVSGGSAGDTLYVQLALALAQEVRAGHIIVLRLDSDLTLDCTAKVTAVTEDGADSYLTVKLLEDDDNSGATNTLADATSFLIIGNANAEGALRPDAISYDPLKIYNYTQIFRTALSATRTAQKTRMRTGDVYKRLKKEALELHSLEMERARIWGIPTENTGSNGKPERTSGGILHFLRQYAPQNIADFRTAAAAGTAWKDGGSDWLDEKMELLFRFGKDEKMAFCGSGALLGINQVAKANSQYQMTAKETAYGIKVVELVSPFGVLYLKRHPLFSYNSVDRNSMLIIEPEKLKTRVIDDTFFKPDESETKSTASGRDGKEEEFLTEDGLEIHHPECFGYLNGVGLDAPE